MKHSTRFISLIYAVFLAYSAVGAEDEIRASDRGNNNPTKAIPGIPAIENDVLTLFRVGDLDGEDSANDEGWAAERRTPRQTTTSRTVQVRKSRDFPRKILPGQRVAVFLGEPVPGNCLLKAGISGPDGKLTGKSHVVDVYFNQRLVSARSFRKNPLFISVPIPEPWFEMGGNVLEFRNNGLSTLEFSGVDLSLYSFKREVAGVDHGKSRRILSDIRSLALDDLSFQEKSTRHITCRLLEMFKSGGSMSILRNCARLDGMYDPITGEKRIPAYAVDRMLPLLEGNPVPVPCGMVPLGRDVRFSECIAYAVLNQKGVATIQASAPRWEAGKEVEVFCLFPWSGKASMEITSGLVPEKIDSEKLETIRKSYKEIEIKDGLFVHEFKLGQLETFRIVFDGAKEPGSIRMPESRPGWRKPRFDRRTLSVTEKRIPSHVVRMEARKPEMPIEEYSDVYKHRVIDATPGEIDGVKGVVPWYRKSDLIEIKYREEKDQQNSELLSEGIGLNVMGFARGKEFSFWVYPRSRVETHRIPLRMYYSTVKGNCFLEVYLEPEKWQRVVFSAEKTELPSGPLVFAGKPADAAYKDGNMVSFELNGFAFTGKDRIKNVDGRLEYEESELVFARKLKSGDREIVILGGKAGGYAEYRILVPGGKIQEANFVGQKGQFRIKQYKEAGIVEIKGNFPDRAGGTEPQEIMDYLTPREKKAVMSENLVPIAIRTKVAD